MGSKPCKLMRQMKPQQEVSTGYQGDFFRTELSRMVNPKHPMVKVAACKWNQRGNERLSKQTARLKESGGIRLKKPATPPGIMDTTVQEKHVRFPTDSRLCDRARTVLVSLAKRRRLKLRQSYERVGKQLMLKQSRYAHARQYKRAGKCGRHLKTLLGRVIRDIQRKCPEPDPKLKEELKQAQRIYDQQRKDKGKVYSVHAPEVECISKGKAHKRYEFGVKVSVGTSSRGGWHVAAQAHPGNPYDGHTLKETLEQVRRMVGGKVKQVFVDRGYRGHGYEGEMDVHVDKQRKGKTPKRLWKWMKRRAVVEPGISHLKHGHRMNRNRLKGTQGDQLNAVLSAAGMNFRKLLIQAGKTWLYIRWMLNPAEIQLHIIFNPNTAFYPRSLN